MQGFVLMIDAAHRSLSHQHHPDEGLVGAAADDRMMLNVELGEDDAGRRWLVGRRRQAVVDASDEILEVGGGDEEAAVVEVVAEGEMAMEAMVVAHAATGSV